jgi:hypothetical protein
MTALIEFPTSTREGAVKDDSEFLVSTVAAIKKCGVSFSLVILETKFKPFVTQFHFTMVMAICTSIL